MAGNLANEFAELFGIEQAHDFQVEVAQHLLGGKRVVLQAPTGSGKTWTALFSFLHAWRNDLSFPRKCLYAVPLRVLAMQFKDEAERVVESWSEKEPPEIRLQTGEQQDDRTFEGDLIFTTIDQVLSSALSVPYSLGRRRANLNAGAVLSSFLVCDEIHLFPVDDRTGRGALATLITMLRAFQGKIPFLLMTATLSSKMVRTLTDELGAELVQVPVEDLGKIPSQQKVRRYSVVNTPLSAQAVLAKHHSRSIAICNQVQRAVDLFDDLVKQVDEDPVHRGKTEVVLLHSRFIKQHRQTKEAWIREQYGKPKDGEQREESLITVATQAIEVGLDITCESLHTELAPANAVIQRAGRCARYKGDDGNVYIYRLPDDSTQPHLPYDAEHCAATWNVFSEPRHNGHALGFTHEQEIVTVVHDPSDERLLTKIENESYSRWQEMNAAMFRGDIAGRTRLIRQVDSRTILVHDDPSKIRNPYALRGFSLFHGTLRGWINKVRDIAPDWILRYPVEIETEDPRAESRKGPMYNWSNRVHDPNQIDLSPIFVVNPELVAYDSRRGFRLIPAEIKIDIAELTQEMLITSRPKGFETHYVLESYADHIDALLKYYESSGLQKQMQLAGERLAGGSDYDFSPDQFELAVRLALALHDTGKLQKGWQTWSHAYQREIDEPAEPQIMIVHTHYWPDKEPRHVEAEGKLKHLPRPHHAAEGAHAVWPIIEQILDDNDTLMRAVFTAIARHHAPWVTGFEPYDMHPESQTALGDVLEQLGCNRSMATSLLMQEKPVARDGALMDRLIYNEDPAQWLVYALIVRTLRLCDGHALEVEV